MPELREGDIIKLDVTIEKGGSMGDDAVTCRSPKCRSAKIGSNSSVGGNWTVQSCRLLPSSAFINYNHRRRSGVSPTPRVAHDMSVTATAEGAPR